MHSPLLDPFYFVVKNSWSGELWPWTFNCELQCNISVDPPTFFSFVSVLVSFTVDAVEEISGSINILGILSPKYTLVFWAMAWYFTYSKYSLDNFFWIKKEKIFQDYILFNYSSFIYVQRLLQKVKNCLSFSGEGGPKFDII